MIRWVATEVAISFVTFLALFQLLSGLFANHRFTAQWRISRSVGMDIACKVVSGLFALLASATGTYLMMSTQPPATNSATDSYAPQSSPRREHPLVRHIFNVVIAYFVYDLVAMYLVFETRDREDDDEPSSTAQTSTAERIRRFVASQPLIVIHHLAIGVIFTPLMMTCPDHDPGDLMISFALIFEASTPFVSLRAILAHLDLRRSRLYVINGVAMVVVFLCCRILIYPTFYLVYAHTRRISTWAALARVPTVCLVIQATVFLPQVYWFCVMMKGAVKVVADLKGAAVDGTAEPLKAE